MSEDSNGLSMSRRKLLALLGSGSAAAGIGTASLGGDPDDDLLQVGGTPNLTQQYERERYVTAPASAFDPSQLDVGQIAHLVDTGEYGVKDEDGNLVPYPQGTAEKPIPEQHVQSSHIEDSSFKSKPDGPASSYTGQRGGLETTIASYLHAKESQSEPFKRVEFQSGSTLYAVGQLSSGDIYKSTNLGQSWTTLGSVGSEVSNLLKVSATGTLLAVDTSGAIHRSTDDGSTWSSTGFSLSHTPLSQGVTETPSGHVLLAEYGNDGSTSYNVYRSTDDGQSFTSTLSTAAESSATHVHSVSYDETEGKAVAFVDGDPPTLYTSSNEGGTWTKVGEPTGEQPNLVALMFFENYVAWGYDKFAEAGWIARLPRSDFYSGDWDNVEKIARVNEKMAYYTHPIDSDAWLLSFASESDKNPPNTEEVYVVFDDGSKVAGGFEHDVPLADVNSLGGKKVTYPTVPFDETAQGQSWANISTGGVPRDRASVPIQFGERSSMPSIGHGFSGPSVLSESGMYTRDSTDTLQRMLYWSGSDNAVLSNPKGFSGELRVTEAGATQAIQEGQVAAIFGKDGSQFSDNPVNRIGAGKGTFDAGFDIKAVTDSDPATAADSNSVWVECSDADGQTFYIRGYK